MRLWQETRPPPSTTKRDAEDRRHGFRESRRTQHGLLNGQEGNNWGGVGAGALFLVFGTHAPSYVKTAYHKVRRDAKNAVPLPFDIERAREEIASLEPAIRDNIEKLARAEVEVEHLDKEIVAIRTNMDAEKKALLTLRESLKTGEYRLAGHSSVAYTEDEVKADLARRYDAYNNVKVILEAKESTLKAKQSEIVAFRKQLETMMAQKKELSTKLDKIEAKLQPDRGHPGFQRVPARRQRPVSCQGDGLRPGEAARGHGRSRPRWKPAMSRPACR